MIGSTTTVMTNTDQTVLLLGFEASPASGAPPTFTNDMLLNMLQAEQQRCNTSGYDMDFFLLDPTNPNIASLQDKLHQQRWDVVSIGFGVRGSQGWTGLFETLVNSVVEEAKPVPKFAFNLMPNQVVEAVERVLSADGCVDAIRVMEGQYAVKT